LSAVTNGGITVSATVVLPGMMSRGKADLCLPLQCVDLLSLVAGDTVSRIATPHPCVDGLGYTACLRGNRLDSTPRGGGTRRDAPSACAPSTRGLPVNTSFMCSWVHLLKDWSPNLIQGDSGEAKKPHEANMPETRITIFYGLKQLNGKIGGAERPQCLILSKAPGTKYAIIFDKKLA